MHTVKQNWKMLSLSKLENAKMRQNFAKLQNKAVGVQFLLDVVEVIKIWGPRCSKFKFQCNLVLKNENKRQDKRWHKQKGFILSRKCRK